MHGAVFRRIVLCSHYSTSKATVNDNHDWLQRVFMMPMAYFHVKYPNNSAIHEFTGARHFANLSTAFSLTVAYLRVECNDCIHLVGYALPNSICTVTGFFESHSTFFKSADCSVSRILFHAAVSTSSNPFLLISLRHETYLQEQKDDRVS